MKLFLPIFVTMLSSLTALADASCLPGLQTEKSYSVIQTFLMNHQQSDKYVQWERKQIYQRLGQLRTSSLTTLNEYKDGKQKVEINLYFENGFTTATAFRYFIGSDAPSGPLDCLLSDIQGSYYLQHSDIGQLKGRF